VGLFDERWSTPIRLTVTVVLLTVVVVRNNIWSLPGEIGRANAPLLAVMLVGSYVAWLVNTLRWQRILAAFQLHFAFSELFRLNLAGVFYSLSLPGQVSGEVVKALRIAGRTNQRRLVYISIFHDRVYGLIGLALLGCIALALAPPQFDWPGSSLSMLVLLVVMLVGLGVVLLPWLSKLTRSGRPTDGRLGLLIRPRAADGSEPPFSMLAVGCALGLTAQALTAGIQWGVASALGLSVSPLALTWILALGTIVGMFPISFAGLGVREATYVGLLSLFGVSAGPALALSLTMFAILIVLGLTGGILDLLARGAPSADGQKQTSSGRTPG
jgi:uncharacterized membrane protein YbhN (UPF0104 family)